MELKIDKEIDSYFDALEEWEYENLKANIKKRGIKTLLDVAQDGTIVCGNNRFKIAQELKFSDSKIPYEVVEFKNKQEMIDYAIDDNIKARGRNMNLYQRSLVGLRMLPNEKKKAKQRQVAYLKKGKERIKEPIEFPDFLKFGERGAAQRIVAKRVNVSQELIRQVKKIEESPYTTDEQKRKLKSGEKSINAVFKEIKFEEKKMYIRKEKRHNVSPETYYDVLDMKIFKHLSNRFAPCNHLTVEELKNIPSIRIRERDGAMSIISYTDYGKRVLLSFACSDIDEKHKMERYKLGELPWDNVPGKMIKGKINVRNILFIFEMIKKCNKEYVEFKIKDGGMIEFISEDYTFDLVFEHDENKSKNKTQK